MVSLRRMGTIITQLEAERLGALDALRGDDATTADAEEVAVVPQQIQTGDAQAAPPC